MLHQPTLEKLLAMRMEPMVETWRSFEQDENAAQLSFEEKLSLMVDRLWTWRQNLALERRLRYAKLRGNACVEDIDYRASRGLDRTLMRSLANDSGWVQRHENIFIIGPTRRGEKLPRLRAGPESLPRRTSRALHPCRSVPFPYEPTTEFLILDHDSKYGTEVPAAIGSMDIQAVRTAVGCPWQNGVAERWVGSCRRELLDHVIAISESHLKRLLSSYVEYYHQDRTHCGLQKQTPKKRRRCSGQGKVVAWPRVGRLHHRYERAA